MSADLVGPLRAVRYVTGPTVWRDLPRNTLDIRYVACGNHHLACDCREAERAEEIGEHRAMYREVESVILAAIKGHSTYGFTAGGFEDELAECKCAACGIARAAFIGFAENRRERHEADERLAAEADERRRMWLERFPAPSDLPCPDDEVPF